MRTRRYCPSCRGTEIELIGGIAGSVAVRCSSCGWSTPYQDDEKSAVEAFDELMLSTIVCDEECALEAEFEADSEV